jgi:hypothetical protein
MILRPLNIKDAPALVDLLVFFSFNRQLHQRERGTVLGTDFNV